MKQLKHLSVTSLRLHSLNPRRWVLQYLEGLKDPPSFATDFGSLLHKVIEERIRFGKSDKEDQLQPKDLQIIKDWESAFSQKFGELSENTCSIEHEFSFYIDKGLPPIKGIIDLYRGPRNDVVSCSPAVFDHKTANPRYAETSESLLFNWQLGLYAHYVNMQYLRSGSYPPSVIVGHNQFIKRTTKPSIKSPHILKEFKIIQNELTGSLISSTIEEMRKEGFKVLATIKNYEKYGLEGIEETPHNRIWYGKVDPYWPIINRDMTIHEFKQQREITSQSFD